ncbi:dihydrofolate reductase family protein [Virgibacillus ihumii]|uniref:dihydrofolate reductase family protein n=1 Tax=Virgibacillus ihumii TaxID=2686091 RepID=UPI00157D1658|nr:dihydrofolate reductase family protein [Virgibacillus ihumii]
MGKVVIDMSISLDGFVAGPNDNPKQPLGENAEVLHNWLFSGDQVSQVNEFFKLSEANRVVHDKSLINAGAMIVGRGTYDIVNGWGGSHPNKGVPVFVVTHRGPETIAEGTTPFTFVSDGVVSAVKKAKAVSGDKEIGVAGANISQQCLKAGLVDEIFVHIVPVTLGKGKRLFEEFTSLEIVEVINASDVTHIRYKVIQ